MTRCFNSFVTYLLLTKTCDSYLHTCFLKAFEAVACDKLKPSVPSTLKLFQIMIVHKEFASKNSNAAVCRRQTCFLFLMDSQSVGFVALFSFPSFLKCNDKNNMSICVKLLQRIQALHYLNELSWILCHSHQQLDVLSNVHLPIWRYYQNTYINRPKHCCQLTHFTHNNNTINTCCASVSTVRRKKKN